MIVPSFLPAIASSLFVLSRGLEAYPDSNAYVVTRANELFNGNDTGVAFRLIGMNYTYPWWACKKHTTPECAPEDNSLRMSVLLLNKYMLDGNVTGGRFPWNIHDAGVPHLGGGYSMGYLATEGFVDKHTRCIYPVDGNTFSRSLSGCGPTWSNVTGPTWCDHVPQDIVHSEHFHVSPKCCTTWDGCYSNRSQFPDVLQAFHAVKTYNNSQYGWTWNELVLDGVAWNAKIESNLWAWVSTPTCMADQECNFWFFNYTTEYERTFKNKKPILILSDYTDTQTPAGFSLYEGDTSTVVV
jgi:hypothetical protein